MPKIKVSDLEGVALDWAVAQCEVSGDFIKEIDDPHFYGTDWALAGPIIERELIRLDTAYNYTDGQWCARMDTVGGWWPGETPLIAAMRCYVASRMTDEVEIPEELL